MHKSNIKQAQLTPLTRPGGGVLRCQCQHNLNNWCSVPNYYRCLCLRVYTNRENYKNSISISALAYCVCELIESKQNWQIEQMPICKCGAPSARHICCCCAAAVIVVLVNGLTRTLGWLTQAACYEWCTIDVEHSVARLAAPGLTSFLS